MMNTSIQNEEKVTDKKTSSKTAAEVEDIIQGLSAVLEEENNALKEHDIEKVKTLLERKTFLTRSYQERMIAIKNNPSIIQSKETAYKEQLKEKVIVLEALMKENDKLLKANIDASGRVLKAVVNAAKSVHEKDATYSGEGTKAKNKGKPVALSVNQTI